MVHIYLIHIVHYLKVSLRTLAVFVPLIILYLLFLPSLTINGELYVNPYIHLKWWTILVAYFSFICVGGVLGFIMMSTYLTIKGNRVAKLMPRLTSLYVNILVEYLYAEKYKDEAELLALRKRLKHFGSQKMRIEAFFASLAKIQETVAENHSEAFKKLIKDVDIEKVIDRFLYSYNLSDRILAIRIVSYLRIKEQRYIDCLLKYAKSKNFALRSESYGGLIRMVEGDNKLAEFIGTTHDLSLLDIDVIVNAVLKNFKMNIDYADFLSSPIQRKVIVGLILSKYRYRKGRRSLILILNYIGDDDPTINYLAWDAFLNLVPKDEAADIIIDRFDKEEEIIQLMILQNAYGVNNQRLYLKLKDIVINGSLLIKVEALRILFKEQFEVLAEFYKTEDPEIKAALGEVADVHINL